MDPRLSVKWDLGILHPDGGEGTSRSDTSRTRRKTTTFYVAFSDVEKAKRLLGFEARTPLDTMLDEVIPWVRAAVESGRI